MRFTQNPCQPLQDTREQAGGGEGGRGRPPWGQWAPAHELLSGTPPLAAGSGDRRDPGSPKDFSAQGLEDQGLETRRCHSQAACPGAVCVPSCLPASSPGCWAWLVSLGGAGGVCRELCAMPPPALVPVSCLPCALGRRTCSPAALGGLGFLFPGHSSSESLWEPLPAAVPAIGSARRWWCGASPRGWWALRQGLWRDSKGLWAGASAHGACGPDSADSGRWALKSPVCPPAQPLQNRGRVQRERQTQSRPMGPEPSMLPESHRPPGLPRPLLRSLWDISRMHLNVQSGT